MKKVLDKLGFGKKRDLKEEIIKHLEDKDRLKQQVIESQREAIETHSLYTDRSWQTLCDISKFKDESLKKDKVIAKLQETNRELTARIGGLSRQNKKITSELEETKKQLEESMTDKFLRRPQPADRTKSRSVIGIRSSRQSSQTKKILNEKLKLRENE